MIGFLPNPGSSLIRSLKSDPHPAFRSSCPFVFRLLRKNLVNPSIESYPARQRRSYSSAAGMARTSATIRNSPLTRSEEHTSELQSRGHLVCRLLLEKKKEIKYTKEDTAKNKL